MEQFQSINRKIGVGTDLHRRSPRAATPLVKDGAEETNDNITHGFI